MRYCAAVIRRCGARPEILTYLNVRSGFRPPAPRLTAARYAPEAAFPSFLAIYAH